MVVQTNKVNRFTFIMRSEFAAHSHFLRPRPATGSRYQILIYELQILQNKAMKIIEVCKWYSKNIGYVYCIP